MSFTKHEAAEWATWVSEVKSKFEERDATYGDLCSVLDDLLESVGHDAEAAGWYEEWEKIAAPAWRMGRSRVQ